jgi:hypothetical protein
MNSLIVDEHNEIKKPRESFPVQHPVTKAIAIFFSYVFHPVFVPVYVLAFMLYVHPWLFAGYDDKNKLLILAQGFMMLTFFPLVTVLLLKGLKFIESIYLKTQKDRIIPFIACMTWYFWLWYVWNNMGKSNDSADMPREAVQFAFAIFVSTILGLMANIVMKISLHAIAMGLFLCFIVLLGMEPGLKFGMYISLALVITGLVSTSRFIVSDHTPKEVYGGLALGIISMLAGHLVG